MRPPGTTGPLGLARKFSRPKQTLWSRVGLPTAMNDPFVPVRGWNRDQRVIARVYLGGSTGKFPIFPKSTTRRSPAPEPRRRRPRPDAVLRRSGQAPATIAPRPLRRRRLPPPVVPLPDAAAAPLPDAAPRPRRGRTSPALRRLLPCLATTPPRRRVPAPTPRPGPGPGSSPASAVSPPGLLPCLGRGLPCRLLPCLAEPRPRLLLCIGLLRPCPSPASPCPASTSSSVEVSFFFALFKFILVSVSVRNLF